MSDKVQFPIEGQLIHYGEKSYRVLASQRDPLDGTTVMLRLEPLIGAKYTGKSKKAEDQDVLNDMMERAAAMEDNRDRARCKFDDDQNNLAARLKAWRLENQVTQRVVAKVMGITNATLVNMETGRCSARWTSDKVEKYVKGVIEGRKTRSTFRTYTVGV